MNQKKYSGIYRAIHWSIAISFVLLLITIFLRMTWMNKYHVSDILQENLIERGVQLSEKETIAIAKKIRKPMWEWHIYIGYVLVGLFSIRFILPFWGEMRFQNPFGKELIGKQKFQYWVYIVFYILVTISLVTGLFIKFGPKSYKENFELIHIQSIYYLVTYIILHLAGVFLDEFQNKSKIISRIISGDK